MDPLWQQVINFRRFEVYEQYSNLIVENILNEQKQMELEHGIKEDVCFILDDISCEKTKNSHGLNCIANQRNYGKSENLSVFY